MNSAMMRTDFRPATLVRRRRCRRSRLGGRPRLLLRRRRRRRAIRDSCRRCWRRRRGSLERDLQAAHLLLLGVRSRLQAVADRAAPLLKLQQRLVEPRTLRNRRSDPGRDRNAQHHVVQRLDVAIRWQQLRGRIRRGICRRKQRRQRAVDVPPDRRDIRVRLGADTRRALPLVDRESVQSHLQSHERRLQALRRLGLR